MPARFVLPLQNAPTFGINDNSTDDEQLAVFFNQSLNTGIVDHGYSGEETEVSNYGGATVIVSNPGSLVIAPNQTGTGSDVSSPTVNVPTVNENGQQILQPVRLRDGSLSWIDKHRGVISAGNELVPGGLGMSPNLLSNMPDSMGSYKNTPVWNYSAMELVDALPVYQGTRARLLDNFADIVESGEYDFFIEAFPINQEDAAIAWKDTHRGQFQVPPGSYLVAILCDFN